MSTVAIIASILPCDKIFTLKDHAAQYRKGEIIASKIWFDGYPFTQIENHENNWENGVLEEIHKHQLAKRELNKKRTPGWYFAFAGNRLHAAQFDTFLQSANFEQIRPYHFIEKLEFDHWVKANWDAEYLYWLEDPYEWKWKELHHFNERYERDLTVPDGPWHPIPNELR